MGLGLAVLGQRLGGLHLADHLVGMRQHAVAEVGDVELAVVRSSKRSLRAAFSA